MPHVRHPRRRLKAPEALSTLEVALQRAGLDPASADHLNNYSPIKPAYFHDGEPGENVR